MHHATSPTPTTTMRPSALAGLRTLIPTRNTVTFAETLRIAEVQAARLLAYFEIDHQPTPSEIVSELPHITVVYDQIPVSGASHWNGQAWIITLNRAESRQRQRFTLMHEFKHIIDHPHAQRLYRGTSRHTASQQAEHAADYFAGCVLIPRRALKNAWGNGIQRPEELARHFDVSVPAITVRLAQTGLVIEQGRCGQTSRGRQINQWQYDSRRYR